MENSNVYEKPVTLKNILKFAVPTIAMTVFMSFYTMVDGLFVSNLIGTKEYIRKQAGCFLPKVTLTPKWRRAGILQCSWFPAIYERTFRFPFGEKHDEKHHNKY